ncbi:hypothetical protein [Zavarzinia sp.]|uniref:hypothetical protein n=1 Tax=Zavarzinia sp. TaxID=2027920 RepID=UPI0035664354
MPLPNLIHPVEIVLSRKDNAATVFDPHAREPVREVARQADLRIDAQVSYNPRGPEYDQIGPAEKVTGYLLMLQEDLADRSYIPKRGDRITSVEGEVTSLWITHVFNAGHYPGHGATMRRAYFTDRRPGANLPTQG